MHAAVTAWNSLGFETAGCADGNPRYTCLGRRSAPNTMPACWIVRFWYGGRAHHDGGLLVGVGVGDKCVEPPVFAQRVVVQEDDVFA